MDVFEYVGRVYTQNRMARVSLKVNRQLTCDLAIVLSDIHLREMKTTFTQKPIREFPQQLYL